MTDASGPSNASPPASTSSDDLTNLRSSVDFSPLTVQKDRRYGVVTAFSDSLAFIYWDESEGNWIFRPELAAFGCGVVYQPEQFGWLVEAEEIVKNGEEVNWPSDYSDEEKAGLVADLKWLANLASNIKPCTSALGSETDYPFLPIILRGSSLDPKSLLDALGANPALKSRVQHTNLDIPEDQLKEWYEDRILSRDSYDPDSTELEDKEREWRPLWDALLQLRGRNLKCVIAGEMLCNPCVVLIVGWGSVKGTEDKMGTIIGLFSGVVYT